MQKITTLFLIGIFVLATFISVAQDTTSFEFSGYAELYWGLQQGESSDRPEFLYNHTTRGGNINLGYMRYAINHNRWRLVAAPMLGTYVRRNLASEPNAVRNLYEASIGYRFGGATSSRIDIGILPSYIGLESNIGKDQLNVTRGLLAENTPYYACGLRWSGTNDKGLNWALFVLNGWQRIGLDTDRNWPAFGMQIQHKTTKGRVLNYSNYLGSIDNRVTMYHNTYAQWVIAEKWRVQAEVNYESVPSEKDFLGGSIAVGRSINKEWAAGCRVEQMRDERGLYFKTAHAPVNLNPGGWSVNVDYSPLEKVKCRLEARRLWSAKGEQLDQLPITSAMWLITAAACVSF